MSCHALRVHGRAERIDGGSPVHAASIALLPGEIHGILGARGSGKSTLLHAAAGVTAFHGTRDVGAVGLVLGTATPAEPEWRVNRYLRYFGALHGMDKRAVERRASHIIPLVGLAPGNREARLGALDAEAWLGVELVRALLHAPAVLCLDDPEEEIDLEGQSALPGILRRLAQAGNAPNAGPAILVATSTPAILPDHATVTLLHRGSVLVIEQDHGACLRPRTLALEELPPRDALTVKKLRDLQARHGLHRLLNPATWP